MFHVKRSPLDRLADALDALEAQGLRRVPSRPPAGSVNFCSNDYLGLAGLEAPGGAPWGAGASRLVSGNTAHHEHLEQALAAWLEVEASLVFTSGYAANVGALSAVVQPGDRVLSDALNHASIIDGLRLARANVEIYPHLDAAHVAQALARGPEVPTWVVTESYFSMDADVPDLGALSGACRRAGAGLYVDEAHAVGVFGPGGRGLAAAVGVQPDVLVGTLGKALGAGGAFVAGRAVLRDWLWNRARSFVFSTGLSPALAREAALRVAQVRSMDAGRARLGDLASELRAGLRELGCTVLGEGPVVPWVIGDPRRALAAAAALRERGYFVQAIRPPTVPQGTARLRLAVGAAHESEQIQGLLSVIKETRGLWAD